jgi:hypothetical protein
MEDRDNMVKPPEEEPWLRESFGCAVGCVGTEVAGEVKSEAIFSPAVGAQAAYILSSREGFTLKSKR